MISAARGRRPGKHKPDRVEHRVRATPRARAGYELHYRCSRELYPAVAAAKPGVVFPDRKG
jgi:hypothetical protein